jgi:outer membrane translocation and assembly module TamA
MARIDNNQVPVEVSLTEFPKQKLELGLTYDSEDGPGYPYWLRLLQSVWQGLDRFRLAGLEKQ